ncbi:MAG: hypothetical protein AAGU27_02950 [Dehalobacterium sp.]
MPKNQELCEIRQHFLAVAPYINQFTVDDMGLSIFDTEKVIWDVHTKTLHFEKPTYVGEPIVHDALVNKAMKK